MSRHLAFSVTLDDCEVQTFRAGGKGGQNQNKRDTGVRVIHHPSGARGEARDERSQHLNKRAAFVRMANTAAFRSWVHRQADDEVLIKTQVERDLWPDRIKVEVQEDGRWVEA